MYICCCGHVGFVGHAPVTVGRPHLPLQPALNTSSYHVHISCTSTIFLAWACALLLLHAWVTGTVNLTCGPCDTIPLAYVSATARLIRSTEQQLASGKHQTHLSHVHVSMLSKGSTLICWMQILCRTLFCKKRQDRYAPSMEASLAGIWCVSFKAARDIAADATATHPAMSSADFASSVGVSSICCSSHTRGCTVFFVTFFSAAVNQCALRSRWRLCRGRQFDQVPVYCCS